MSPSMARAIAADLRSALPGVGFAAELPEGMRMEREYPALHQEDIPADGAYSSVDTIDHPVGKLASHSPWQTLTRTLSRQRTSAARPMLTMAWHVCWSRCFPASSKNDHYAARAS
jgi:hypothetical protein